MSKTPKRGHKSLYRRFTLQGELRRIRRGIKDPMDRHALTWAIQVVEDVTAWQTAMLEKKRHPACG